MNTRLLVTDGQGEFREIDWIKPEIVENEIEVKAVMTGICRSDIDMMVGKFGPLPHSMSGHEGLGIVTKVGKKVQHSVKEGDYVATRGEPAYADFYNVKDDSFVKVPALAPEYILEPVACGINLINNITLNHKSRLLILGSGFLARVACQALHFKSISFKANAKNTTVVGKSNAEKWGPLLKDCPEGRYDVIIDLSNNDTVFKNDLINPGGTIVIGAEKHPAITTDFSEWLWKSITIHCPSPRDPNFRDAMVFAEYLISEEKISVDDAWTRGYDRDREWKQAFKDGLNRPKNYNRGYLIWN